MKKYEAYKDSGIEWMENIPANWDIKPLKSTTDGQSSSFMDGDWIESPVITDNGIRYLTTGNVGVINYKEQGNGYISEKTFDDLKCSEVFPGDILMSRLNLPLSRACIVPELGKRIVTAVDNVIYRPDATEYDNRYMVYLLNSPRYAEYAETLGRGTTMKRISRSTLGNVRICVPPKDEQQTIANYLDHKVGQIDASVSAINIQIDDLKALRQSVISEAVTKGLNPNATMKDSGIEWIGQIPEGWELRKLKTLLERNEDAIKVGPFGSALSGKDFTDEGYWVYNQRTILDNNFETNDVFVSEKKYSEMQGFRVQEGDLLITTRGTIGKVAIVPENHKEGILHPCVIRFRVDTALVDKQYVKYIFNDSSIISEQVKYNSKPVGGIENRLNN